MGFRGDCESCRDECLFSRSAEMGRAHPAQFNRQIAQLSTPANPTHAK